MLAVKSTLSKGSIQIFGLSLARGKEALALAKYAEERNEEVEIYVQHIPCQAEVVHFITGPELDEEFGQPKLRGEQDVVPDAAVVDEAPEVVEVDVDGEVSLVSEATVGVQAEVMGEAEVMGQGDVVTEVQMEDEAHVDLEAELGGVAERVVEAEVRGEEDVICEEVESENDEGAGADKLDDSEEERVADDDDGFGVDIQPPVRKLGAVLDRWKAMKRNPSTVRTKKDVGEGSFVTNAEIGVHDISEEYDTDELESDVDSENGMVRDGPKFSKYRAEDMTKDFKFKLGMEFRSLKEFKQALMEHSVLNGKEVQFVKNDQRRVRAVCKKKCGFLIMVSKVGGRETFQVKTLVGRHRCGRVFGNKNANKDWIAQVLIDRYMNVGVMTVSQIIDEIKKTYSVGITPWRAGKAKQIAMDCLVGDGQRQYGRLHDYIAELVRVKAGTVKIKINQPQPSLPPRFGCFYMCLAGFKTGFLAGCRPFIGVDGCHLKTAYGGQLLVAVGRDPNDQYYPLAFAAVENECKETWRWFLTLLLEDIGDVADHRWVFISDQQKVI